MTRGTILKEFREQGAHAYQAELAADFLADDSTPHHLLITPVGLGKVLIASLIAKAMAEAGGARRILVVAPSPYAMLWRSRLESLVSTIPVELVHGRAFREMVADSPTADSPWPEAFVAIVPSDAATRPPIAPTLPAVRWDLVIVAEVQPHSECSPSTLYRHLLAEDSVGRSLLITDAPMTELEELLSPSAGQPQPPWPEFAVTDWSGELSCWDGEAVQLPPPVWRVLDYARSDDEVDFFGMLHEELRQQSMTNGRFHFQAGVLLRRAASCPLAVERSLDIIGRQLSRTPLRASVTVPEEQYGDPVAVEDVDKPSFTPDARKSYLQFVRDAFDRLQGISADAKLACFLRLMKEVSEEMPGKICVLAANADTVTYLHDALLEVGTRTAVLNGNLKYLERQQVMKEFVHGGGVLLATAGALGQESDLNRVKHVVFYDLPTSAQRLSQLEGRFGRINRTRPCRMYALRDQSAAVASSPSVESLLAETQLVSKNGG